MSILDDSINDLLHTDDLRGNKLLDLRAPCGNVYFLSRREEEDFPAYMLRLAAERLGKPGNTLLRGSASAGGQMIGRGVNALDWADGGGRRDVAALASFTDELYRDIRLKGGNPLFLGLGAIEWRIPCGKNEYRDVLTPLIILPVLLARGGAGSSVALEFVDDDAYLNPCLFAKLSELGLKDVADGFPRPCADENGRADITRITPAYYRQVSAYAEGCRGSEDTVFSFDPSVAALARYDHGDVCMYRDILACRSALCGDEKTRRIFERASDLPPARQPVRDLQLPLDRDSVQEEIAGRIAAGESLIIKGPPGSGKTQTIANIVSALMGRGQRVLMTSKKLSALGEVYAKLPDALRPFAMLLESETESQAANLAPEAVASDLKATVRARETYKIPGEEVYGRRRRAVSAKLEAERTLAGYREAMFTDGAVAGLSYYDALDICAGFPEEPVPFVSPEEAAEVSARDYGDACSRVAESAALLEEMTGGGSHPAVLCPWFGMNAECDAEGARNALGEIASLSERLFAAVGGICGAEKFTPRALAAVCRSPLTDEEREKAASLTAPQINAIARALRASPSVPKNAFEPFDGMRGAYDELVSAEKYSCGMSLAALRAAYGNVRLMTDDDGKYITRERLDALAALSASLREMRESAKRKFYDASAVLKKRGDMTDEEVFAVLGAERALAPYAGTDREKPGAFDFAAKRAVKAVLPLLFDGSARLPAIAEAVCVFCAAEREAEAADELRNKTEVLLRRRLTDAQADTVLTLAERIKGEPSEFFSALPRMISAAENCAVAGTGADMTLRELADAFREGMLYGELTLAVGSVSRGGAPHAAARAVLALSSADGDMIRAAAELSSSAYAAEAADAAEQIAAGLSAFAEKYYANALTRCARVSDLHVLVAEWKNRRLSEAAMRFSALTECGGMDIRPFLSPIAEGKRTSDDVPALFKHSFFAAAAEGAARKLGNRRNGLGRAAADAMEKRMNALKEIAVADTELIAARCYSSIDPEAKEFAFLGAERSGARTLRRLFKDHAAAVTRVKKCLILSPSTVSLLLGSDEFFDFDVGIVDEASQLEPAGILPVLARCRTVVLVGDEWQMPPIRDFRAAAERGAAGDDDVLEADASALSVALANEAFRVCELACHYRSRTESLIAFSQRRYYPFMRTFPSALPMIPGELGFTDVYVPDGACERGVNRDEAEKVLRILRAHFDKYYDEKTETLSRSLGVVAFGEPQTEYIRSLALSDNALAEKMRRALASFGDVPEKLIFFKTIRTVQGQETDDLILSLTYGRRADGALWQRFGTLNRGTLGECVFNVAVTRARCSVTVVHSVLGSDLRGGSVDFIGEYLDSAARFARGGRSGFAGKTSAEGFIGSVGEYIRSLGVPEERIVYDCGVTDGSVRVPIAVLGKDMTRAVLGVWCERRPENGTDFYDLNVGYYDSLAKRGWKLHRVFAHDWIDNAEAEKKALADAVKDALGAEIKNNKE